jgi:hypothetical protein
MTAAAAAATCAGSTAEPAARGIDLTHSSAPDQARSAGDWVLGHSQHVTEGCRTAY